MAAGRCVVAQVKQFIAHQHAVFVSPKAIQEMGAELDRHPVGTGPFKFGEWQDDVKIVGERFDKWAWGPRPPWRGLPAHRCSTCSRATYVRTARSKRLRERVVVVGHALRNALVPVVTVVGLEFGGLLGGAVIVEAVYLRQGLGLRLIDAIIDRDYPVVQGLVLMSAVIYAVVNLLVDVLYTYIDPRVRLETTGS